MEKIGESELILNPDGSVYHLNLKPEDIARDIIFVGDQDRVNRISKYFTKVDFETQKREFKTTTGWFNSKRFTVISTGIGPDNIDIVMNELDALVNIDLKNRTIKPTFTALNIVRIGTSGSLQTEIPVDSFVMALYGLGFDGLLQTYQNQKVLEREMEDAFINLTNYPSERARPYIIKGSSVLEKKLFSERTFMGITATANGFYGPQGRKLRLKLNRPDLNDRLKDFNFRGIKITNLEMETSAIYGLSRLLGHEALSLNAIIANRVTKEFSKNPYKVIDELILYTLEKLST